MKRRKIFTILTIVFSLAILALTVGCSKKNDDESISSDSSSSNTNEIVFSLDKSSCSMTVGDTAVLVASNYDEKNVTVIWKSSDESVATVDGGVISAVGAGDADITATAGRKNAGMLRPAVSTGALGGRAKPGSSSCRKGPSSRQTSNGISGRQLPAVTNTGQQPSTHVAGERRRSA